MNWIYSSTSDINWSHNDKFSWIHKCPLNMVLIYESQERVLKLLLECRYLITGRGNEYNELKSVEVTVKFHCLGNFFLHSGDTDISRKYT
uniref:Uncharacterized protein n=1 Tax=Rhizophora mucronata TaxID=61149 RepID=A0A2P2NPS8_RHIMU